MPATQFNFPAYASANPAVAQLFKNEFAQKEGEQRAYEALANTDTERARITAQSRIADAQLRQAQADRDRNDLFRIADLQDRRATGADNRALLSRQLDIEQKYKEALGGKQGNRTAADDERFAADSETIANQLNAAFQNKLAVGKAAAKKAYDDTVASLGWFGSPDKAKAAYDQTLTALEDKVFNDVQNMATQYFPPASFKVDPFSKKFLPAVTRSAPSGQNPAGLGSGSVPSAQAPDPAAGLFNVGGRTVPVSGGQGTVSFAPSVSLMDDPMAAAAPTVTQTAPPASTTPIRVPVTGGTLEMPSSVAESLEAQLRSAPPEQRQSLRNSLLSQLRASGQIRFTPTAPAAPQTGAWQFPPSWPTGY